MELSKSRIPNADIFVPKVKGCTVREHKYNHILPKQVCCLLTGNMGRGKSTLAFNIARMLLHPELKPIVISQSLEDDPTCQEMINMFEVNNLPYMAESKIVKKGGENILETILDTLRGHKKAKQEADEVPDDFFIFLDDQTSSLRRDKNKLADMIRKYRHINAHIVICTHRFLDIEPSARRPLNLIILFQGSDIDDLKKVYKECNLTSKLSFDEFLRVYNIATSEPHSFLYIRRDDASNIILRKNFDIPFEYTKTNKNEISDEFIPKKKGRKSPDIIEL